MALVAGVVALMFGLIPSRQPQQVALNGPTNKPAPASSPTPATIEPAKPETNGKQKESEAPGSQPPQPQRKPRVREPKPGEQRSVMLAAILSITGLVMWWRSRGWKKALAKRRRERALGEVAAQAAE